MRRPDINENPLGVLIRLGSQLFGVYVKVMVVWFAIVGIMNFPWIALAIILTVIVVFYSRRGRRRA